MAISQKLLNPGENVIISTRTHPKALLGPVFLLVLFLAVGVVVQVKVDQHIVDLVVWVLVAAAIVWFVIGPVLEWLGASYTVTNRRLITRHGLIARRGHDIPLTRISDVAYEFGIIDRMLGCGTLLIADASTNGQVQLPDIPHVEETQRKINQLLQDLTSGPHQAQAPAHDDGA